MSAANEARRRPPPVGSPRQSPREPYDASARPDAGRRERERRARQRRRVARVDVGVGAAIGLGALVFGPGLGILTLLALLVIAGCAASFVIDRRRARGARCLGGGTAGSGPRSGSSRS